jgi:hypothetical protein
MTSSTSRTRRAATLLLLVTAVACPRHTAAPAPKPTGSGSAEPPSVTVLAENLLLVPGAQNAVRVGFAPADPSVRVIASFADIGAVVGVCALASPDAVVPAARDQSGCINDLASGVRETLVGEGELGAVALWVRTGPSVTVQLQVEYSERNRRLELHLPASRAQPSGCRDNACNPFFEVVPVRGGEFSARATWSGGPARLALLEGRVLAHSYSATGIPYNVPAEEEGSPPLTLATHLSAPAEYALVLDQNTTDIAAIDITARWP